MQVCSLDVVAQRIFCGLASYIETFDTMRKIHFGHVVQDGGGGGSMMCQSTLDPPLDICTEAWMLHPGQS